MGCDIHTFIERKNKETGAWEHVCLYRMNADGEFEPADVYINRNYDVFGKIAGVRSSREPFVPQRGVPQDLSDYVRDYYYDGIGEWHSGTWYDWCELAAYVNNLPQYIDLLQSDSEDDKMLMYGLSSFWYTIQSTLEAMEIWHPEPGDVRIVMWFDN